MEWIEPKTDWTSESFFNYYDYNRIIGNLAYLKAYLDTLFINLTNTSLGEEKDLKSLIYAREFNAIEYALEKLNLETYNFNIGYVKSFQDNKHTFNWNELNRIESAILLLYKTMIPHKENLMKIEFTLGGQKGFKV